MSSKTCPPRLVILIYSLGRGGAERVAVEFARFWSNHGAAVTVVTLADSDADFFTLPSGVRRISLGCPVSQRGAIGKVLTTLSRLRELRRFLRGERPDAAIGVMTTSAVLLALAAKGLGIRTIGSERTYPPNFPLGRVGEMARKMAYRWLTVVVAQTQQGADWVKRNTWARSVAAVPNSVIWPLPITAPIKTPAKLEGRRMLLAVGRLGPEKQFEGLIRTFADLAPAYADWDLAIVGDGALASRLAEARDATGRQDRIFLIGAAGNVADWYRVADAYVLSSSLEGFPNTLLEAMSHGVPAVAFDCPTGPRDMIVHEKNGLLAPVSDFAALSDALSRVMSDQGLRAQLSLEAVGVRKDFSEAVVMRAWSKLYGPAFEGLLRGEDC